MSKRAIAAALLLTSLGGCTIFGGSGKSEMASNDTDLSSYFDQRLAAGRSYLKAGLPAKAVTAFRQASYDADRAAEAYNGMGVAYAMQGRPDVARRMFGKAVKANPYDERFSRNLARLETRLGSDAMLAKDETTSEIVPVNAGNETLHNKAQSDGRHNELPPVANSSENAVAEPFTFPRTVTSSGGLALRNTKETRIATVDHGDRSNVSPWAGTGGNLVSSSSAGGAGIVSQKATRNPAISVYKPKKGYPLRVAITGSKPTAKPKAAKPAAPTGYPVRVALGSHTADERR